ncbi:MAG: LPS biosynthesis protein WbpP [Methanobacteriota archaeon]|jgi:UDP-N-acetylglucosamine 4-epimerase|nr:MAG: LPS biosynthesis protein WbpP [Euryarchaeota archaeon]
MISKVLVTGGAGFIGSHICDELIQKKIQVVCIDNLISGFMRNINHLLENPRFTFIKGDIRDWDTCISAIKDCDAVCHQAALGSVPRSIENPIATNAHNITGTLNIFHAARINGIKRVVYASSSSVYGDEITMPKVEERIGHPLSPYAITKRVSELYSSVFTELYSMEMIGLRYFNIFGPRQDPGGMYAAVIPKFVQCLIDGNPPIIYGDGNQTRDFTFVSNAVQANISALMGNDPNSFGSVYNIACGGKISVNQLFSKIREILSESFEGIEKIEAKHVEPRQGDVRHSLANISKAEQEIGYLPTIDINTGLIQTVKSFY